MLPLALRWRLDFCADPSGWRPAELSANAACWHDFQPWCGRPLKPSAVLLPPHQLFYLGFLMIYSYVVLVKMPDQPSPQEWVVILYIFTSAVEKIREVCAAELFLEVSCLAGGATNQPRLSCISCFADVYV